MGGQATQNKRDLQLSAVFISTDKDIKMDEPESSSVKMKIPSTHVRFTEKEFLIIQKMQQTTGLSFPDLLKKALFRRVDLIQPLLSEEAVEKIMVELRRQGNNINQIAKQINSGLAHGWNQAFNGFVRAYVDIRHIISENSLKALASANR